MSRRSGLDGLARWTEREEWAEQFDDLFDKHYGALLDRYDLDFEDLDELLGEDNADMLWSWVLEDFATWPRRTDGQTVVDDYLKRRGWKETATNRRLLEALRDSAPRLWQVVAVQPRRSVTLVDLVFGGDPVEAEDPFLADLFRQGDRFAGRVVEISGRMRLAGATLVFPEPVVAPLLEGLQDLMRTYREEVARTVASAEEAEALSPETIDDMFMMTFAGAFFSGAWLDGVLSELIGDEIAAGFNTDGETLLFHTLRFTLAQRSAALRLRARLDDVPGLTREAPDHWLLLSQAGVAAGGEAADPVFAELRPDGREVLARLDFNAGTLTVVTNSAERAGKAQGIVTEAAGDLLGSPETVRQTLDQYAEANPQSGLRLVKGTVQ